jgi:membrane-associated protease RseP (regulator of RpoE activity)
MGLLALSVLLLLGGPLAAADGEQPRPPLPPGDGLPGFAEMRQQRPPGIDPELHNNMMRMMEHHRAEMMRQQQEMQRQMPLGMAFPFRPEGGAADTSRLGARLSRPTDTLAEQLALPRGQGLVLGDVSEGSAAAKAGLKPHDILLEMNGKPVSSNLDDFARLLETIKEDTPVEVVVLRRGKNETLKGLKLPKAEPSSVFRVAGLQPPLPLMLPGAQAPFAPPLLQPGMALGVVPAEGLMPLMGGKGVMTTLFRDNNRFVVRHQEGGLIITLTGKADGGKAIEEIRVQDGHESSTFASVDKVPEPYRAKVKNLVELLEKSQSSPNGKSP